MAQKKVKKSVQYVLVRSNLSGVWIGELVKREGMVCVLRNAHKIWRWTGAKTTSDLALTGCRKGSRVAPAVTGCIVDATGCEVIESNALAYAAVASAGWAT